MGKVTKTSSTRKMSPKPKNKRRKTELDKIHSKILKAKSKLDNIEKHGNKRYKRQNQAKICSRLLPKLVAGIYRNGAKGKDIQRAETSENKINNARLKADALQLFNGDTPESKENGIEIAIFDEPTVQSPNKSVVENSLGWVCESEQSPVLGKQQDHNQNTYLVKKKNEDVFFKKLDSNRNRKKSVNEAKDTVQKEVICKRKLFQNDEQSRTVNAKNLQLFETIDLTQEDTTSKENGEETCSENKSCNPLNKNKFWDPSSRYEEFCSKMSAGISDGFSRIYQSDPIKTTLKKLGTIYTECYRQQLLREKKTQSVNPESVEYQACTYSDSQISPVEFEIPRCDDENDTITANLSENITQKINKLHRIQNFICKKDNETTQYDSTSRSSQNTFAAYKNDENNSNQFVNRFPDISQPHKPLNLCFVNETHSVDLQRNSNRVSRALKQNRHRKDNCVNYKHSRGVDNAGHSATFSFFSNESALSAEKPLPKTKLPTADVCAPNDTSRKCNDRTANEYNIKNIKQIPKISRRYNDITEYPNMFGYSVPTPSILNVTFDRSQSLKHPNKFSYVSAPKVSNVPLDRLKSLDSEIGSMKIKDLRDFRDFNNVDINVRSNKVNGSNRLSRFSNMSHSQTFGDLHNSNTCTKTLLQQKIVPEQQVFRTNNACRSVNYLRAVNIPEFNIERANQVSPQAKVYVCKAGNATQQCIENSTRNQSPNILFNDASNEVAPTLDFPQNSQFDKRCGESTCEKLFSKTDAEYAKNRTSQNARRCNERCIYHDFADYPSKRSAPQAHYFREDTVQAMAQPSTSCHINIYSSNTNKSVEPSNGLRNASFLSLGQKCNSYTCLKTADNKHRVVLLQNVTQPIKYFAVKNDSGIQRIPIYINNSSGEVTENIPLKVVALMDPNSQTKAYPQKAANQANSLPVDEFEAHETSAQSVNTMLFNSDLQSNIWYASHL